MTVAARVNKIEEKLRERFANEQQRQNQNLWPFLGELDKDPSIPHRSLTPEEFEIAKRKGKPIPIVIALSREQEWQEYLKQ